MKKILLFLAPLLIAIIIFFGVLFFLDRKNGKGALQVISVPESKVYLGNKLIGNTPLCACNLEQMLPVGDYNLRLIPSDESFRPYDAKITINKSTLTAVDRTFANNGEGSGSIIGLSPIDNKKDTEISIVSLPDKANVFLDNNPVGVTPLLLKQVSESDHDLRLTRDGYRDKLIKIKTALGFKLKSLVFLGINNDLSNPSEASSAAVSSPLVIVPKVLILNTPTGFLRVRESASINSTEITQVKPGEVYELIGEEESWFKIRLKDEKTGWISSSYAAKE